MAMAAARARTEAASSPDEAWGAGAEYEGADDWAGAGALLAMAAALARMSATSLEGADEAAGAGEYDEEGLAPADWPPMAATRASTSAADSPVTADEGAEYDLSSEFEAGGAEGCPLAMAAALARMSAADSPTDDILGAVEVALRSLRPWVMGPEGVTNPAASPARPRRMAAKAVLE